METAGGPRILQVIQERVLPSPRLVSNLLRVPLAHTLARKCPGFLRDRVLAMMEYGSSMPEGLMTGVRDSTTSHAPHRRNALRKSDIEGVPQKRRRRKNTPWT